MDKITQLENEIKEQKQINNEILKQLMGCISRITQLKSELQDIEVWKDNLKYEITEEVQIGLKKPKIRSIDQTIDDIICNKKSLVRYGDGEFGILFRIKRDETKFQDQNENLSIRLKEIFVQKNKNILIGIADNYGSLEKYTPFAANGIRHYMTSKGGRCMHEQIIDYNRVYENAYLSRPYVMFKDQNTDAPGNRFEKLKRIWKDRDVIIVEGALTRMGVGNDLLDGANSIQRILAPAENAYDQYDEILACSKEFAQKDTLFLIALGPTAGVLAYDLAMSGYQAIDIGHIDLEYEWYLAGEGKRVAIPYKYNNEITGGEHVKEFYDEEYDRQILVDIIPD